MAEKNQIKMSELQSCMQGSNIEGEFTTIGVVVSKVPPKTSKNVSFYYLFYFRLAHAKMQVMKGSL